MSDISIEFHATERELGEWLEGWYAMDGAALVAMAFNPFSVRRVDPHGIRCVLRDETVRRLILIAGEPNVDVKSKVEFERVNHDELVLDVGRLTREGLRESWLACRSDNAEAIGKWRRIANDLRAKTNAGVTATSRQNGVSAYYKSHRYSQGAKELEDTGTAMLPTQGAGGPVIRLGIVGVAPDLPTPD